MTMNEHVNELDLPLSDHLGGGLYAMSYHRAGCEVIASPPYYQMEIPASWERLRSDGQWLIMRPPGPFLGRLSPRRCLEPCRSCLPDVCPSCNGHGGRHDRQGAA